MAHKFIKELKEGDRIKEFFLVKSKRQKTTKSEKIYLDIDLVDKSGTINGKVWDRAEHFSLLFSRGEVVKVRAIVEKYQNRPQLKIAEIRAVSSEDDFKMSDFIRCSSYDAEEMLGFFRDEIEKISDQDLKALLNSFFDEEKFIEDFKKSAAARNIHHSYQGGLLEHTMKVTKTALFAADTLYPGEVNRDLLLAGAILHDIGKIHELDSDAEFSYTTEGYLMGHLMIGASWVKERAWGIDGFSEDVLLELMHIILSHHGEKEWGSPIVPMTPEAMIIHMADNLDAKTQISLEAISEDPNEEEDFTQYVRVLGRHFYKSPGQRGTD
jgi:3'-5' exoribonuclease